MLPSEKNLRHRQTIHLLQTGHTGITMDYLDILCDSYQRKLLSTKWLPLQTGISPLQVLLAMHVLEEEPTKSNPTSQLNLITLEKIVTVPKDEPLVGEVKAPQSTAIRDKENSSKSFAIVHHFSYIVLRSDV